VTIVAGRLIIAGGTTTAGPTNAILSFDPATGAVRRIGTLPFALTHASAAAFDGHAVVVGGKRRLSGGQVASILAIDPATGRVSTVGHLPQPLSDAAVVGDQGRIIVAGGENGAGPQSSVLALAPP
jgi:outer membrane protein assembly factor BamB